MFAELSEAVGDAVVEGKSAVGMTSGVLVVSRRGLTKRDDSNGRLTDRAEGNDLVVFKGDFTP